jgi:hypothetical protein
MRAVELRISENGDLLDTVLFQGRRGPQTLVFDTK